MFARFQDFWRNILRAKIRKPKILKILELLPEETEDLKFCFFSWRFWHLKIFSGWDQKKKSKASRWGQYSDTKHGYIRIIGSRDILVWTLRGDHLGLYPWFWTAITREPFGLGGLSLGSLKRACKGHFKFIVRPALCRAQKFNISITGLFFE